MSDDGGWTMREIRSTESRSDNRTTYEFNGDGASAHYEADGRWHVYKNGSEPYQLVWTDRDTAESWARKSLTLPHLSPRADRKKAPKKNHQLYAVVFRDKNGVTYDRTTSNPEDYFIPNVDPITVVSVQIIEED